MATYTIITTSEQDNTLNFALTQYNNSLPALTPKVTLSGFVQLEINRALQDRINQQIAYNNSIILNSFTSASPTDKTSIASTLKVTLL